MSCPYDQLLVSASTRTAAVSFFFHFRSEPIVALHRFTLTQVVVFLATFKMVSLNLRLKEKSEAKLYDQGD